jgi:hypothetical protein
VPIEDTLNQHIANILKCYSMLLRLLLLFDTKKYVGQEEAKRSLIKGKWGLFMFTAYCFYDANKYYPEFLIKRYIEGVEEVKWQ